MSSAPSEVERSPPRRRPIVAGSGWLLVVCLFLPTLRVCGDPMMPIQFPPMYVVYLGAGLLAVLAVTRAVRARRRLFVVWLVLWGATSGWWLAMAVADEVAAAGVVLGIALMFGLLVLGRALMRVAWHERTLALAFTLHGLAATIWNALLAFDRGALWGAWVALGASMLMLIAGSAALVQEHVARRAGAGPANARPRAP